MCRCPRLLLLGRPPPPRVAAASAGARRSCRWGTSARMPRPPWPLPAFHPRPWSVVSGDDFKDRPKHDCQTHIPPSRPAAPPGPATACGSRRPRPCTRTRPCCSRGTRRTCSCFIGLCVVGWRQMRRRLGSLNRRAWVHPFMHPFEAHQRLTWTGRRRGCTSRPPASGNRSRARGSAPAAWGPIRAESV